MASIVNSTQIFYNVDVLDIDIATKLSNLQIYTPNVLSVAAVRGNLTVSQPTLITLNFTLSNRIYKGSYINVYIPS